MQAMLSLSQKSNNADATTPERFVYRKRMQPFITAYNPNTLKRD